MIDKNKPEIKKNLAISVLCKLILIASLLILIFQKHQCFSSILPPTKLTPINNKIQIGKYKMQKRHVQQKILAPIITQMQLPVR
jgi:hypothetical protein